MNNQEVDDVSNRLNVVKLSEESPIAVNTGNEGKPKHRSKNNRKSQPSNTVLKELAVAGITPLKKNSLKFPNAAFYCNVCDYHCDTVTICRKHISESRHRKSVGLLEQKATISVLPRPNSAHEEAISELITKVAAENSMDEAILEECKKLREYIEKEITKSIPDISLLLNGSCLSGFALQSSGLDLDLVIEKANEAGTIFEQVYKIIFSMERFKNQTKSFTGSYPQLCFTDKVSGMEVFIGLHNAISFYTNELLNHYAALDHRVKILGITFRYWARLCEVDKFSEGTLPPRCFILMVVYFLQRCKEPVLPCLHEDRNEKIYKKPDEFKPEWKSSNESSVGSLWLELLRFYALGINFKTCLIDITSPHYLNRTMKWSIKIGIEEPLSHKNNTPGKKWMLSQAVTNNDVFYFIYDTLRNTFFYFLVPQRSYGSLFHVIEDASFVKKSPQNEADNQTKENTVQNNAGDATEENKEPVIKTTFGSSTFFDIVSWPSYDEEEDGQELIKIEDCKSSYKSVELSFALKLVRAIQKQHLVLRFDSICFTRGDIVPVRCSVCHMGGHTKNNCVEFDLPPLCSLPKSYSPIYELSLTAALNGLKDHCQPGDKEVRDRKFILEMLQSFIRVSYPQAVLSLFGSSSNGFGFSESDLDICLTFTDNETGKDIDQIQIIKNLAQKLKTGISKLEVRDILAITTAKVPIVKFYLPRFFIEVDISLYNVLAIRNTKLLSIYTRIDERVQILGYAFKFLAKLCYIGDASRGSLSSYAYILLVIHYLQNCNPPLLPVLQELHTEESKPEDIVDGWNTWFYDDLQNIANVWDGYRKNDMSVAQLWIGLLRYYTETFDWESNAVSIKQRAPLSRLEKMWNTQCIAIEDPFDLNHNLGGGLSRRMSTFIMKCFIRGREAFAATAASCTDQKQIVGYAFSSSVLTDGYPPNDRGCRCCGKIGHIVKECPKKKQTGERKRGRREVRRKQEEYRQRIEATPSTHNPPKTVEATAPDSSMTRQATPIVPVSSEPTAEVRASPNSYSVSDFFKLVGNAGSLPSPRPTVQPQYVPRCPKKSEIVPPPGFPPSTINNTCNITPSHVSLPSDKNVYNYSSNFSTSGEKLNTQYFYGGGANPYVLQGGGNCTMVQSPGSSANATGQMYLPLGQINVKAPVVPVQMLNRQMQGFPNTTTEAINRRGPLTFVNSPAEGGPQVQTHPLNLQGQSDALNVRSHSDNLNIRNNTDAINIRNHSDAINARSHSDVLNTSMQEAVGLSAQDALARQAQAAWNRQLPAEVLARQYSPNPMGRALPIPTYVSQSPRAPSDRQFPLINPGVYASPTALDPVLQQIMYNKFGGNSLPVNLYNGADGISHNLGVSAPYQFQMPNSQNFSPDQQKANLERSFRP